MVILTARLEKLRLRLFVWRSRVSVVCVYICAFAWPGTAAVCSQDLIVLRDLKIIRGQTIVDFDASVVRLSDGRRLQWDAILKAKVETDRQAEFDSFITRIGLPLFRLRRRIANQDWAAISELAEPLYAKLNLKGLKTTRVSESAYLICVATMKGRLFRGDRPGAVLPFLQAAMLQQAMLNSSVSFPPQLPDNDVRTMLSAEILPIWFDRTQVEQAYEELVSSFDPASPNTELGAIVYLASMAIEMKRLELADDLLKLIENRDNEAEAWRLILLAQVQIAANQPEQAARSLEENQQKLVGATIPLSHYLKSAKFHRSNELLLPATDDLGNAVGSTIESDRIEEFSTGMLQLLEIPASYSQTYPALSAAALYQTAQIAKSLGWSQEAEVLEQELTLRFPLTFHGRIVERRLRDEN